MDPERIAERELRLRQVERAENERAEAAEAAKRRLEPLRAYLRTKVGFFMKEIFTHVDDGNAAGGVVFTGDEVWEETRAALENLNWERKHGGTPTV